MRARRRPRLDAKPDIDQERLARLRTRFERTERLWLSPEGLKFWLDASVEPHPPGQADLALSDEIARLRRFELLTADGHVPDEVRPAIDAIREPLCTIDIEASVGRSLRHFRSWVGRSCAVLFTTDTPWADVEPTAESVASADQAPGRARALQIVTRDQPLLAAARWALVTPRRVLEPMTLELGADIFTRRLADHTVPVPVRAHERLTEIWAEPMFTWAYSVSPTNESFLVLDAGRYGHRQVVMDGDQVVLHALPPLALWNGMVATMANALDT